jgi:hypothetical protein
MRLAPRTMILALTIAGCNGGGESTTAATAADTGSTGTPGDTGTPMTGDTGTPVTSDTGTPATDTGEPGTGESGADTTDGDPPGTTGGCTEVPIVGQWLSEGDNVAPLLVDVLDIVSIDATFDDVTFEVNSTDGSGNMGQQLGTYVAEACPGSETKMHITLEQTSPSAITVEGIFEIDGCMDPAVMRYEVIQVQPDLGAPAPTCDDDFGAGPFGADNIQTFVRQ